MLTFFTTAKPFRGHSATIQCNALQSWKLLHPDIEVILFGDEEGTAEVCAELGLRHEPHVERNERIAFSGYRSMPSTKPPGNCSCVASFRAERGISPRPFAAV
jgi:hypothetical protein